MGTLLFELMCGLPPFYDQNTQRMYQKIQSAVLRFPPGMSTEAKDILSRLLCRSVPERLGSTNDVEDIKADPFFAVLDWDKVYNKQYEPELKPEAGEEACNFDEEFTSERPIDSVVTGALTESQKASAQFHGFTFQEDTIPE
jgi:serum/glucocorticoid-regulated kinase 2